MGFIAIDIGGSSIKSCRVDQDGSIFKIASNVDTIHLQSNEFSEIKKTVLSICRKHINNGAEPVIGISTSGSVDNFGTVISAGHFKGYCDIRWSDILADEFGHVQVCTVNDGRASAWGEYSVMPEKAKTHVHVVVGTGIGGGVIHDGELLKGDSGQAGYIGHIKVSPLSTPICSCGKMGCVESLASAPGIVVAYHNSSEDPRLSTSIDFEDLLNKFTLDSYNIFDVLKKSGYWLGIAVGNVMNILNPQIVTVGGGVIVAIANITKEYSLPENPYFSGIKEGVHYATHRRVEATGIIKEGVLGNTAGLIGAASLAYYKADPQKVN